MTAFGRACDNCNAEPGEPCRPNCTAHYGYNDKSSLEWLLRPTGHNHPPKQCWCGHDEHRGHCDGTAPDHEPCTCRKFDHWPETE